MLHSDVSMVAPKVKLPGGEHVRGTPMFRMVDPQSQGLSGVVRLMGSLTGAVDKHCLDLAAWQGMTPQERIQNHIDDAEMERIQESHRCSAPRGHPPDAGLVFGVQKVGV